MFTTEYIGVIDGMKTWIVKDEEGNIVGKNESPEITEEGAGDAEIL